MVGLRRLLAPALVACCVLGAVGGAGCAPKETSTVTVERRDVRETAVASGRVVALARIEVGVVGAGVVAEVKVEEGQAVKAGDVLLRLDDRVELAAVAQARAAVAQARARLVEVKQLQRGRATANLMAADAELARAKSTLERTQKLAQGGASTIVDLESSDTTVSVEITTGLKKDALVVPLEAVRDLATKAPFVLVVTNGVAEKTPVTLGARGSDVVEITSGVADGAVVVRDQKVKAGAKVTSS